MPSNPTWMDPSPRVDSRKFVSYNNFANLCGLQMHLLFFETNFVDTYSFAYMWKFLKKNSKVFNLIEIENSLWKCRFSLNYLCINNWEIMKMKRAMIDLKNAPKIVENPSYISVIDKNNRDDVLQALPWNRVITLITT